LALAQAGIVSRALTDKGVENEIVTIETAGDRRQLDTSWGEGAFVTAIEQALADGRVDVAVHSAKDVPTEEDGRLRISAYLLRAEALDALVLPAGTIGTLDTLAAGTTVGTDSPRRTGFLRARRPDLDIRPLNGNVDTRLRRLDEGEVGALVLAAAGLGRLGRAERISELLPVEVMPPAPGQGAICVQVRAGDPGPGVATSLIDHLPTRHAVEAERAFLRATGGGCRAPIGALASVEGAELRLVGGFAALDGRATGLEEVSGPPSERETLAKSLAVRIMERRARLPGAPRVLVTRPADDSRRIVAHLAELGVAGVVVPTIEIELLSDGPEFLSAVEALADYAWAIVTSANGARAIREVAARADCDLGAVRWAAVGRSTARELVATGVPDVWTPTESNAKALGGQIPVTPGESVLWVRGELADDDLIVRLRERGADVTTVTGYRTIEAPASSRGLLFDAIANGPIAAVILASPSAVRGLLALAEPDGRESVLAIPAVCVGPRTVAAARSAGFVVIGESPVQDAGSLAELAASLLARGALDQPQ
jgi:hydroxymethylbilane synthase